MLHSPPEISGCQVKLRKYKVIHKLHKDWVRCITFVCTRLAVGGGGLICNLGQSICITTRNNIIFTACENEVFL